jgi:hypothetical protein
MTVLLGSIDTTGGSGGFFTPGDTFGSRFECSASGTVETLSIQAGSSGYSSLTLAIYADSAGVPGARLGTSASTALDNALVSLAVSPGVAVSSGSFYWLFELVAGGNLNLTMRSSGGFRGKAGVTSYPDPWNTSGDSTFTAGLPIQAEGTEGGGPAGTEDVYALVAGEWLATTKVSRVAGGWV